MGNRLVHTCFGSNSEMTEMSSRVEHICNCRVGDACNCGNSEMGSRVGHICNCRVGEICYCSKSRMGSRVGYEYRYRFSMVDDDEINSKYKSEEARDGVKTLVFEFRTNFIIISRSNSKEEGVADTIIIDSERFDAHDYEDGGGFDLHKTASYRLKEYWMPACQMLECEEEAFAFAKQMVASPQHASLRLIPVVVDLDVCTVQQENEPFDACMDRAIRAKNLLPLHLWPYATVERRPLHPELLDFLRNELRRIRVESIDEWGFPLKQVCGICSRNTSIGAQVSMLPRCKHVFHSHCIVRWLEGDYLCPTCRSPAYDGCVAWMLLKLNGLLGTS